MNLNTAKNLTWNAEAAIKQFNGGLWMSVFKRILPARNDSPDGARPMFHPELLVHGAMLSDVGLVRDHNEDVVAYAIRGMIALVADGMGGHAAGEVASALAAETIVEVFYRTAGSVQQALAAAFAAANQAIRAYSADDPGCRGMGTTCTAFSVCRGGVILAHIGDSRGYLLRNGTLHRLSRDHSLVARMCDDGLLSAEEAAVHPDRNVIVKALGTEARCQPDIWPEPCPLRAGDALVLCSDGLSDLVDDGTIAAIVSAQAPAEACAALCNAALAAGGHDNVSVGVFAVTAPPANVSDDVTRPVRTTRPVRIAMSKPSTARGGES
jgi:protein phosphatase